MFEDLKFYKQVFYFDDGYGFGSYGVIEEDYNYSFLSDAYGLTTEICCSSVELPPTSYKPIDTQYAEGMINRGLYTVKFIQSGKSYNNLEDLHHDHLVLKLAGVNYG